MAAFKEQMGPLLEKKLGRAFEDAFASITGNDDDDGVRDAAAKINDLANDTLGVRLWLLWFSEGKPAQASALAVCLALASAVTAWYSASTVVSPSNQSEFFENKSKNKSRTEHPGTP